MHADDIVVFRPTAHGLRSLLTRLESINNERWLLFSMDKTKCIIFDKSTRSTLSVSFSLNGSPIENIHVLKKLGCFLNDSSNEVRDYE